jgi:hypothetical protein
MKSILGLITRKWIKQMGWQLASKTTDIAVCNPSVSSERYGYENAIPEATTYGRKSKGCSECRPLRKYFMHRRIRLGFFSFFSWKRGYWVGTCAYLAKVLNFSLLITFKFSLLPVSKLSLFLRLLVSIQLTDGEGVGRSQVIR